MLLLWHSKIVLLIFLKTAFSDSMKPASIEMEQFVKETRTNKDILNFENYESVLTDFDTYPIVSKTEKNSSWCEVEVIIIQIFFENLFQGIQLVHEVRDVNGKLYSRISLTHPEDTLIITDTGTQIVHNHPRK